MLSLGDNPQGAVPEAFVRHLAEAVLMLGYYRPEAIEDLAAMYSSRWDRGTSSTMFRRSEVEPLLSEKGLADVLHAQKATYLRAIFNYRRDEFHTKEPQWSTFCSRVQLFARAQWLCDQARELDQTVVNREDRWPLPLANCAQEWCPCYWMPRSDI